MKNAGSGVVLGGCALMAVGAMALVSCAPKQVKVAKAPAIPAVQAAAPAAQSQQAAAATSAQTTSETFAQAKAQFKVLRFRGTIQSVASDGSSVTVLSADGATRVFQIASDTQFNRGGGHAAIGFSDLQVGDHVKVTHAGDYAGIVHVMVLASASN